MRQQINVLRRTAPKKQTFSSIDRLIFVCLYRLLPGVRDALAIVKPETVVKWHRAGFRLYDEIPDPLEPSTLQSAMLDWAERDKAAGRKRLELVRELLAIRRREIVPRLPGARFGGAHVADSGLVTSHWRMGSGTTLSLAANLSDHDLAASPAANGTPIWGRALREGMPAWSVRWQIG